MSTVTVLPPMGDQLPTAVVERPPICRSRWVEPPRSTAQPRPPWRPSADVPMDPRERTLRRCAPGRRRACVKSRRYGEGEVVLQLVVNGSTFSSLPAPVTVHATEGTWPRPRRSRRSRLLLRGPPGHPRRERQPRPERVASRVSMAAADGRARGDPWLGDRDGLRSSVHDPVRCLSSSPCPTGSRGVDQVVVSVQAEDVPVAVAKAPPSGYAGDTLALDGTESHDPAGRPLSFAWKQVGGPRSRCRNSSMSPTFLPESKGTYVFQLKVSNGQFTSPPVTVTTQVQDYPTLRGGGCTSPTGADWMGVLSLFVALPLRRRTSRGRR